jgi:hypothetical protein
VPSRADLLKYCDAKLSWITAKALRDEAAHMRRDGIPAYDVAVHIESKKAILRFERERVLTDVWNWLTSEGIGTDERTDRPK